MNTHAVIPQIKSSEIWTITVDGIEEVFASRKAFEVWARANAVLVLTAGGASLVSRHNTIRSIQWYDTRSSAYVSVFVYYEQRPEDCSECDAIMAQGEAVPTCLHEWVAELCARMDTLILVQEVEDGR